MVSYSSSSEETQHNHQHHQRQRQQQNNSSEYCIHSLQRPSAASKPYKKPLNSLAKLASGIAKPRVYRVKPIHFRELVQRLTGASPTLQSHQPGPPLQPQPQSHPPLSVPPYLLRPQYQSHTSIAEGPVPYKVEQPFAVEPEEQKPVLIKNGGSQGTAELALSPNFQPWFSLALLSPGSVL